MQRCLGIDLGDARVGLAISDELNCLAHPLQTLHTKTGPVVPQISQIITEKNVGTVVVGMPRNMDGSHGPAAEKTRQFIESLKLATAARIIPWDERLSTVSAQRSLREAGRSTKDQRKVIDQAAAQIILQSWMDSQSNLII